MPELTVAGRAQLDRLIDEAQPGPEHRAAAEALLALDEATDASVAAVLAEHLQPSADEQASIEPEQEIEL